MLTYWLFRLGSALSGLVPSRLGYLATRAIADLVYFLNPRARATVKSNLLRVLGPNADARLLDRTARGVFRTGVTNYFELLRMPHLSIDTLVAQVDCHGFDNLDAALAGGRGAVMVSAHFGSFESTAQVIAARGYRLVVPAEPIKPPELFEFVSSLRSSHGLILVPAERTTMRTVVKSLRQNAIVGFPVDRDAVGGGLPFEFFGELAPLQPTAVSLARRERCPVVPAFAVRRENNRSDIYIEPPIEMQNTTDEAADLQANMRAIISVFERYIGNYPDQWVAFVPVWPAVESENAKTTPRSERQQATGQGRSTHS